MGHASVVNMLLDHDAQVDLQDDVRPTKGFSRKCGYSLDAFVNCFRADTLH